MAADIKIVEEPQKTLSMHPLKFSLWLFMVSISMIFIAMSSAYIVRQADGNWRIFELPVELWVTTGIIILSSLTLEWSYKAATKDDLGKVKIGLIVTTILGILFLLGQLYVWMALVEIDVYLVGNPSGSFLYVLTGLHGIHLIAGVIYLVIVLISTLKYKVHSKNLDQIEMCKTFWHFLGGLWIYLFVFLLINH